MEDISQPFALTLTRNTFNVHEKRIIYRIVEALQPDQIISLSEDLWGFKYVKIPFRSLMKEGAYDRSKILAALKRLQSISFETTGEDEKGSYTTVVSVITQSKLYRNNQMIELLIAKEMAPMYLSLANGYTRYKLDVAFQASSSYTMKLYEWFCHWRQKGLKVRKQWSLEYLIDLLHLPKSLNRYSLIKQRVLDPVKKEFSQIDHIDIDFEYYPIKTKRKYTDIVFTIIDKTPLVIKTGGEAADAMLSELKYAATLKRLFGFTEKDINQVRHILADMRKFTKVGELLLQIQQKHEDGEIEKLTPYTLASLKRL